MPPHRSLSARLWSSVQAKLSSTALPKKTSLISTDEWNWASSRNKWIDYSNGVGMSTWRGAFNIRTIQRLPRNPLMLSTLTLLAWHAGRSCWKGSSRLWIRKSGKFGKWNEHRVVFCEAHKREDFSVCLPVCVRIIFYDGEEWYELMFAFPFFSLSLFALSRASIFIFYFWWQDRNGYERQGTAPVRHPSCQEIMGFRFTQMISEVILGGWNETIKKDTENLHLIPRRKQREREIRLVSCVSRK